MFDYSFALSLLPELWKGFEVTVIATIGGFLIALLVGGILEAGRRSGWRILKHVSNGYIAFVRCTPLLVQLYFVFYVLPAYGIRFSALTTGILCLGLHVGAYLAEVYRAGIDSIAVGQWDAAKALGLRRHAIWLKVVLPQALPPMLPPLGNFLIGLFKETPLLAAITVIDLFGAANAIAGRTFKYNEPYTLAAILLLLVSLIAAYGVHRLERRFAKVQR
ncbi:MAG: ectoine/hydroxyectoine ABC transporter permease subunit EhuD [Proteobacteria bacterium]|nr:ectoine/hydroxyectoine ABC transporter permease subunit EhuD [Pseudomonadota bacterium]